MSATQAVDDMEREIGATGTKCRVLQEVNLTKRTTAMIKMTGEEVGAIGTETEGSLGYLTELFEEMGANPVSCITVSRYSRQNNNGFFFSWTVHFRHGYTDYCLSSNTSLDDLIKKVRNVVGVDAETRELLLSL